jgi:hypothetical protein
MKVSYDEGLASHVGSESCVVIREDIGEALTGESAGWVLSSEILTVRDADAVMSRGRQHRSIRQREDRLGPAESQTPEGGLASPCTHRSISRERRSLLCEGTTLRNGSREISGSTWATGGKSPSAEVRTANPKGAHRR